MRRGKVLDKGARQPSQKGQNSAQTKRAPANARAGRPRPPPARSPAPASAFSPFQCAARCVLLCGWPQPSPPPRPGPRPAILLTRRCRAQQGHDVVRQRVLQLGLLQRRPALGLDHLVQRLGVGAEQQPQRAKGGRAACTPTGGSRGGILLQHKVERELAPGVLRFGALGEGGQQGAHRRLALVARHAHRRHVQRQPREALHVLLRRGRRKGLGQQRHAPPAVALVVPGGVVQRHVVAEAVPCQPGVGRQQALQQRELGLGHVASVDAPHARQLPQRGWGWRGRGGRGRGGRG